MNQREWGSLLEGGEAPEGLREPLERARALLSRGEASPAELSGLPLPLALALIERAARLNLPALLQVAEASPEREIGKAARRALHHLRSKGAKLPPRAQPKKAPPALAEEALPSYASYFDSRGDRMVLFLRRVPPEGYYYFQVLLSEQGGLADLIFPGMLSRGEARRSIEDLRRRLRIGIVAIPGAYARALIEEGIARASALSRLPPALGEASLHLGPVSLSLDPHPIYQALAIPGRPAQSPEALLEQPALRSFAPLEDELAAASQAISEVETSPLYIDDAQRARGREDALERVAKRAFATPEQRRRLRRRLEETAYLALLSGDEALASDTLYYAAAFGGEDEARYLPFAQALFRRLFRLGGREATPAEEKTSSGLILP